MITILHDCHLGDGGPIETASADGYLVTASSGSVCRLAKVLLEQGYRAAHRVRIVRADPLLFGPPYEITGIRLDTAAVIDFFSTGDAVEPSPLEILRRR